MRDARKGTYNGYTTFCTVNGYGDCPYCDQCNVCHIEDPMEDCEDFAMFFQGDWNFWLNLDDMGENKMDTKIYVLTRRGEPVYATTDLQKIKDDCQKWFDDNYDNFWVHQYFDWWVEGRNYPNTDDVEDAAWHDYVEAQFENGTWEHYAWYECDLK